MAVRPIDTPSLRALPEPGSPQTKTQKPSPTLRTVTQAKQADKVTGQVASAGSTDVALLVLVRHGQSQWNLENRFTGWTDVPLTAQGKLEAKAAGQALSGITFDRAYTSELSRAQNTLAIILDTIGQQDVAVVKTVKLNERHYGDLQGMNKAEAERRWGTEQVTKWRRGYADRPPGGESLADTEARAMPVINDQVLADVKAGKNVIVVAHGNTLRAIVKALDGVSDAAVEALTVETGVPMVYRYAGGRIVDKKILSRAASGAA